MIGKTISHLPRGIKGSEPCAFNIQAHKEVIFDSNHLLSHGVNKSSESFPRCGGTGGEGGLPKTLGTLDTNIR